MVTSSSRSFLAPARNSAKEEVLPLLNDDILAWIIVGNLMKACRAAGQTGVIDIGAGKAYFHFPLLRTSIYSCLIGHPDDFLWIFSAEGYPPSYLLSRIHPLGGLSLPDTSLKNEFLQ